MATMAATVNRLILRRMDASCSQLSYFSGVAVTGSGR
jgi:hypothetical protein